MLFQNKKTLIANASIKAELAQGGHTALEELNNLNRSILKQMVRGICKFTYTNDSDEVQIAHGTLNIKLIPKFSRPDARIMDLYESLLCIKEEFDKNESNVPESVAYKNMLHNIGVIQKELQHKVVQKPETELDRSVQLYYDLEKRAWCQYRIERLITSGFSLN